MRCMTLIFVLLSKQFLTRATAENDYFLPQEQWLGRNYLPHTFPALQQEWSISFEVNPKSYEEGIRDILHLVYPVGGEWHIALQISIESLRCNSWTTGPQ